MKKPVLSQRQIHILLLCTGAAVVAVVFCTLFSAGIGIPCPIYSLTGLLCPGCGNSRAAVSLLRLDLAAAFSYNPLFLPEFFYIAWIFICSCRHYLQGKAFAYRPACPAFDIVLLCTVFLWGIIRNLI